MKHSNRGFGMVGLLLTVLILALLAVFLVRTLRPASTGGASSADNPAIVDQVQDVVDQANGRAAAVGGLRCGGECRYQKQKYT